MPNHTQNTLELTGDHETVMAFVDQMGQHMDFEKVIAPPKNMFRENLTLDDKERCAREGVPTWYDWQGENWGTKWNAYLTEEVAVEEFSDRLTTATYRFQTAWDAPRLVIAAIIKQNPDIEVSGGYVLEGYEGCGSFYGMDESFLDQLGLGASDA